jgi:hypothetical protein
MRALLLALWLVWATAAAGYRTPALAERDGRSVRIANRDELATLPGAATLRVRLLEAREPQPAPAPGSPPLWVCSAACLLALPAAARAPSSRVLEGRSAREGLLTSRSSRGPPLGAL